MGRESDVAAVAAAALQRSGAAVTFLGDIVAGGRSLARSPTRWQSSRGAAAELDSGGGVGGLPRRNAGRQPQ